MAVPQVLSRRLLLLVFCTVVWSCAGCGRLLYRFSSPPPATLVENPIMLPPADADFVWSQVVDTLDDYFRIAREQPLQASNQVLLAGRAETAYSIGPSIFEPWRKDSTRGFERLQSTFQTIRRRAIVVVEPQPSGYRLLVQVEKEIEDVDREQFASEASASFRHDGSVLRTEELIDDHPVTLGWISMGRDTTLEQQIIQQIFARVTEPDAAGFLHH